MEQESFGKKLKRQVIRTVIDRAQSMYLANGAPKEEDAIHYDNVEEILNIPYMNRDIVPLGMDIFKPIVEETTELPVMVIIHAGGLALGDRRLSRPFGRLLAHKGYLVFAVEYRLASQADVCQQLDDVCAGLDLVGQRLVDYNVDFNRIFIASDSAGAYLTAYVVAMKKSKKLQEAIGYKPTRVTFKAVGLMCGMLYTNKNDVTSWLLADHIYGEKRADENFLQYMDPENPEIVNNLPPVYLITSRGDILNSYTLTMHEALKKAGRPCRLLYYGDRDLIHGFPTMQSEDPRSEESIDKMLAWFEEQAAAAVERTKKARSLSAKRKRMLSAMQDGSMDDQRIWQYIRERASVDPDRMYAPAILDGARTYTYARMFEQWDRYARVFSGLGITGDNHSRAAIVGAICAEPLFALYGLNMTGATVSMLPASDLLPGGRWKSLIEKEHITDLIVSDLLVSPQMWQELRRAKAEFGLRNVLLLHTRLGGPCLGYAEMLYSEFNYHALRRLPDARFMDDLIAEYADTPIHYGRDGGDEIALICHTSGAREPLPYTDRQVNAIASASPDGTVPATAGYLTQEWGPENKDPLIHKRLVLLPPFDFSAASSVNDFANMSFAAGNAIVTTLFGAWHPKLVRAFSYYKVEYTFLNRFVLDRWMKEPDVPEDAFSTLRVVGFDGSGVSPAEMEKYVDFLRAHGCAGPVLRDCGMSEPASGAGGSDRDPADDEGMGQDPAYGMPGDLRGVSKLLKYKDLPKKLAEKQKENREKFRESLPKLSDALPSMEGKTIDPTALSRLPEPLRTIKDLLLIMIEDQDMRNSGYED